MRSSGMFGALDNNGFPPLADVERAYILLVLESVRWDKKEAARVLEIARGTLYRRLRDYAGEGGSNAVAGSTPASGQGNESARRKTV